MFTQKKSKLSNPFSTTQTVAHPSSFVGTGLSLGASPKVTKPDYTIENVYAAYSENFNGSKDKLLGYFTTHTKAHKAAQGQGAWGARGIVEPKRALIIKEGVNKKKKYFILEHESPIMDKESTSVIKANALSKLTKKEKEVLGLA